MGYLLFVLLLGLAFAGTYMFRSASLRLRRAGAQSRQGEATGSFAAIPTVALAAQVAIGIVFIVVTFFAMFKQVPTGNVGVVYSFNRIVGQTADGAQFVLPWQALKPATIQVQGHKFDEQQLSSFSKESQLVNVAATLNISVSPTHIQQLYRTVGPDYFNILVAPRVRQAFKDETVKYEAVDIAPHREEIRQAVRERLVHELSADSIDVRDLLIDDIAFTEAFQNSIEAKQVRTQKALEEQAGIEVAKAQAQQAVETARGEGQAALARAEAQAQANRELAASLTPLLVRQNTVDKLAGNARVVVVPSGQSLILGADTVK
ncbi:MAG: prohibitin family protein [Caulobacteraceae bacterium]|nr:prohibitin family protein [Caulobacteraceae bacterium]